jgi:ribosomal protein S18 acetylase RimI-like enzyme
MSSLRIREMDTEDIHRVQHLMEQLNEVFETGHDISEKAINATFKEMRGQHTMYLNFVALLDNQIAGFISGVIYKTFFHPKGTLLINELVVDSEHRGKKIGEALLRQAFAAAREHKVNEIEVGTTFENKAAIQFYKKNGLKDESIILGQELNE